MLNVGDRLIITEFDNAAKTAPVGTIFTIIGTSKYFYIAKSKTGYLECFLKTDVAGNKGVRKFGK